MTKINKYIFTIIIALFLTGCYDLDRYPLDKPSSETFWQNDDQAKMGIMGVYSKMSNNNVFGIIYGTDCLSDIGLGYDNPGYYAFATGTYSDRNGQVSGKWQNTYDGIMAANTTIRNVSASEGISDNVKKTVIAEAKFLRALYYFHLLDYFGGVPLYDETIVIDRDYNELMSLRASVEDTRKFILDDLTDAIAELPISWDNENYGRVTKGAAYALRGKVYLYAKDYINATKDFEEIVLNSSKYGYELYPEYKELFRPKGVGGADDSNEMVFAIQNIGGIGTNYGMPMTFYMGTRSSFGSCWNNIMPSFELAGMYEYKNGKPFDWNEFAPGFDDSNEVKEKVFLAELSEDNKSIAKYPEFYDELIQMYEDRDPRMTESLIVPYSEYLGWRANAPSLQKNVIAVGVHESNGFIRNNRGWRTYFWRKFVAEGDYEGLITNRAHTPINFPLIRYADVLLMLAESYNEEGKFDDAVKLINKVRQRPSTNLPALNSGPVWLEANSKDEIFKRIMQERAVELAGEGHRFSDIRRWGIAEELLSDKKEFQLTGGTALTRSFESRDYLWPIPAAEIEINPDLKQNPGW